MNIPEAIPKSIALLSTELWSCSDKSDGFMTSSSSAIPGSLSEPESSESDPSLGGFVISMLERNKYLLVWLSLLDCIEHLLQLFVHAFYPAFSPSSQSFLLVEFQIELVFDQPRENRCG